MAKPIKNHHSVS